MRTLYDPDLVLSAFDRGDTAIAWESLPGNSARQSAVLVPLFAGKDELMVLVAERSGTLRRHPGEIAFPGGARDPDDRGPVQTALREFEEETGVSSGRVDILALLQKEHAYTSDFTLYPVAGFIRGEVSVAELFPDPVEVRRLIEIPFSEFLDPPLMEDFVRNGEKFQYPVFTAGAGVRIWGATAWILWRLIRILDGVCGRPGCL